MANDVTTGNQLNAYTGNAALAGGDASEVQGYAQPDLSPLQTMALKMYEAHKTLYDQRIKDRDSLMDMYLDPKIHVTVDEQLAKQLQPKLDRFKELSKMQLQYTPGSPEWYEYQNLYKELMQDNARAKTAQTLKEESEQALGKAEDPHEKEAIQGFLDKMKDYKLTDDLPVRNKYFGFNDNDLVTGTPLKTTYERVVGDKKQTVQYSGSNPMYLDRMAANNLLTKPASANSGKAAVHVYVDHIDNPALDALNSKAADTHRLGINLNKKLLLEKHQADYAAYIKANPNGTPDDFLAANHAGELADIISGHDYLAPENGTQPALYYVAARPGEKLAGFTYSKDGKTRLNVPDSTVLALLSATKNPVENEQVTKEEPLIDAVKAQELAMKAQELAIKKGLTQSQIDLNRSKQGTERAKQANYRIKTAMIGQTFNPEESWTEIFQSGKMLPKAFGGQHNTILKRDMMSQYFVENAGVEPDDNGNYKVVASNIKFAGRPMGEDEVQKMYEDWRLTPAAVALEEQIKSPPTIFDFLLWRNQQYPKQKATFDVQIEGKVRPKFGRTIDPATKELIILNPNEVGKSGRSTRLQSWSNQRKGLGVKKGLFMEDNNDKEDISGEEEYLK